MNKTDGYNRYDIRQGMVKGENERNGDQLLEKIIEAKGEAWGTTFTGFTSCSRLDRGIPRDLSVSGTIVLYMDLLARGLDVARMSRRRT